MKMPLAPGFEFEIEVNEHATTTTLRNVATNAQKVFTSVRSGPGSERHMLSLTEEQCTDFFKVRRKK